MNGREANAFRYAIALQNQAGIRAYFLVATISPNTRARLTVRLSFAGRSYPYLGIARQEKIT